MLGEKDGRLAPLVAAAPAAAASAAREDDHKNYRDDDRCEDESGDEEPARAAPRAQSTAPSFLLMKCGHRDHLP